MQQNGELTYYLVTQFIGLVILAAVIILFILMIQKLANKFSNQMDTHGSELNAIKKKYEDGQEVLVAVYSEIEKLSATNTELNKKITSLQQDITSLSSDYFDNQQISKAIELARKGSSTESIVEKTGLSKEEADAIAKFHGDKSSN